ncbi:MAG: carboxylating nicotinate-nucleotide diphosphorylase [Candidatus Polarisedimenticolia bacterium]
MRSIPWNAIARLAREGLQEDIGPGDVTSQALVVAGARARGVILAQEPLVAAGLEPARLCFLWLDRQARFPVLRDAGDRLAAGEPLLIVEGSARAILMAERTALNFLARLSGIATAARRCVDALQDLDCEVYATRKTTPGWRWLEKDAVAAGGAQPHRAGLHDAVLIKDNHLVVGGGVTSCVHAARSAYGTGMVIEVEVESIEQLEEALEAGADVILLDNMPVPVMAEAARRVRGRAVLEASGGITPDTLRAVASTGVQRISLGALTHSSPAASLSLVLEPLA